MAKHTIAELQNEVKLLQSLYDDSMKERDRLKATLNDVLVDKNVVTYEHYDALFSSYKKLEEQHKLLQKMSGKDAKTISDLKRENLRLKSLVVEKKHNERGAGRKRLPIEQAVAEYRSSGMTVKEIAETLGVGTATVNRVIKTLMNGNVS
jgi:hypothetical protein